MTADYAEAIRSRQAWAASKDGRIAGFAVLVARPGYLLPDNVAVLPTAQNRGIGTRLPGLAEDHARSLGLGEIRLYTNEAMTENLACYARRGRAGDAPGRHGHRNVRGCRCSIGHSRRHLACLIRRSRRPVLKIELSGSEPNLRPVLKTSLMISTSTGCASR